MGMRRRRVRSRSRRTAGDWPGRGEAADLAGGRVPGDVFEGHAAGLPVRAVVLAVREGGAGAARGPSGRVAGTSAAEPVPSVWRERVRPGAVRGEPGSRGVLAMACGGGEGAEPGPVSARASDGKVAPSPPCGGRPAKGRAAWCVGCRVSRGTDAGSLSAAAAADRAQTGLRMCFTCNIVRSGSRESCGGAVVRWGRHSRGCSAQRFT